MPDTATVQIAMPDMGESVTEGIVLEWHVSVGDFVNEGDTVVEVSTDKVDAEVPAPTSGTITKLLVEVDDEVPVGSPMAEMETGEGNGAGPSSSTAGAVADDAPSSSQAAGGEASSAPPAGGTQTGAGTNGGSGSGNGASDVKATPIARRVAEAQGVDLGKVTPTGFGGKVTKEDVLGGENGSGNGAGAVAAAGEEKQLRGPAAMLAKAMDESRAVPTATSFRTIAVDTLDAKRKAINAQLNERGLKTSFTHLVAWAIVKAAGDVPVMVRSFAEKDGKPYAIENGPVNLGIAVDVTKKDGSHGLMVPAIKGAQDLDFAGFHTAFEDLIAKTREN